MRDQRCCNVPGGQSDRFCPACGERGTPVDWLTVAAFVSGPLPPADNYRLCKTADCQVLYFGSDPGGARIFVDRARVRPGFKSDGDGLLCYCFEHRLGGIARDLCERGETRVFDRIKEKVKSNGCACDVRNPSGKCCLADVRRAILALEADGLQCARLSRAAVGPVAETRKT